MYRVVFHKRAKKDLGGLAPKERARVYDKIQSSAENPFSPNTNATKLEGLPKGYRLRIGKIRVVYEIDTATKTIIVWKIRPRGSAYSH